MSSCESPDTEDEDERLDIRQQVNKRFTLNLLIQGAAAHTFTSASHIVRDELEQIRPGLTELYDRVAISGGLNYCIGDIAIFFGRPHRWFGFSKVPQEPLREHSLLAAYGSQLASEETRHLKKIGRSKRVVGIPGVAWCQFMFLMFKTVRIEQGCEQQLTHLAKCVVSDMWAIPYDRLDGAITRNVAFGNLQPPSTFKAKLSRAGAVGYGGVERRGDHFAVVAKAWIFPLLVHELVKGTVELICLHGLGGLEDDVYQAVIGEPDRIEYEAWLLQAGPAMWRRFLGIAPREIPLSETVMHVARLDPLPLEELMLMTMEEPNRAARWLRQICRGSAD